MIYVIMFTAVVGCGGVCGSHAECASTEFGGHVCHCLSGYTGDAYTSCTGLTLACLSLCISFF